MKEHGTVVEQHKTFMREFLDMVAARIPPDQTVKRFDMIKAFTEAESEFMKQSTGPDDNAARKFAVLRATRAAVSALNELVKDDVKGESSVEDQ